MLYSSKKFRKSIFSFKDSYSFHVMAPRLWIAIFLHTTQPPIDRFDVSQPGMDCGSQPAMTGFGHQSLLIQ
jgi:hypothetical protein